MARDHARVNLEIWSDPDFRLLPMAAQHLYLTLWTHPDLTYCGSLDWRPAKLSGLTSNLSKDDVATAADCLQARHFLVIDSDTEECLIRSWIRFDGLMRQPRMAVSCVTAYAGMGSSALRSVVVREIQKLREREPDLRCWADDRVSQVLDHPAASAKDLPTPSDPFKDAFAPGLGQTQTKGKGSVCTPPTPAPTPATSYKAPTTAADAEDFDTFWSTYPRKISKGQAVKAYRAARKKATADEILAGLEAQLPILTKSEPKFIPHAATWLNGERWADDTAVSTRGPLSTAPTALPGETEYDRRLRERIPEGW